MYQLNLKEGKFPFIIKPNLGIPILINLKDYKSEKGIYVKDVIFDSFIISVSGQSLDEILHYFHLKVYIQPILKDTGDFLQRRGMKYALEIFDAKKIDKYDYKDQQILEEDNCIVWDMFKRMLKIENLFGERKIVFKIRFRIKEIVSIEKLIAESGRHFLLFDLVHNIPNMMESKINYHSVAIYDKDWKSFNFIHSTDFHIAQRNDYLFKFLNDKANNKLENYKDNKKKLDKVDRFILTRDFEYKEEFQDKKYDELRQGKYNFNYNLRKLIAFANDKVLNNELDFVLMSGDLIDFKEIARGNFLYKNNFFVFIEILLGLNRGLDKAPYFKEDEFVNRREILAPVFTTVGNHDYRKGHYNIRSGGLYKIFGLNKKDVKEYFDITFFNYFNALRSRNKFIRTYFRFINPNLNYRVKIGDQYSFIFLDTGEDSIADTHDLLSGSPSTKGLKDYQIDLLRTYIQLADQDHLIIVMHTPPIAPHLPFRKQLKLRRKLGFIRNLKWSDFFEPNLKKYTDGRLEKLMNLKYQTIMYNWSTFLKICTGADKIIHRKVDIILCGHTHTIREFRLKEAREAERINLGFYITPYYINVPCEVYTNIYRSYFQNFKDLKELKNWFDVNKPFIFQTQGIGPIAMGYKFFPPGFRYFIIEDNQIKHVKLYSLHLKELEDKSKN